MADFFITGIEDLDKDLGRLASAFPNEVAKILYEEALRLLALAVARTPIVTGKLRASGQVADPVITSTEIYVIISFGNEEVKYAIPVHEKIYYKHITGQAKYLESVITEEEADTTENIAQGILKIIISNF